jgi:hypothetical protein
MISNTAQKKLDQLQHEKIQLELMLEQEQECMTNRLQKQMLQKGDLVLDTSNTALESLRAENSHLLLRLAHIQKEVESWASKSAETYENLYRLCKDQCDLKDFPNSLKPFNSHLFDSSPSSPTRRLSFDQRRALTPISTFVVTSPNIKGSERSPSGQTFSPERKLSFEYPSQTSPSSKRLGAGGQSPLLNRKPSLDRPMGNNF